MRRVERKVDPMRGPIRTCAGAEEERSPLAEGRGVRSHRGVEELPGLPAPSTMVVPSEPRLAVGPNGSGKW